MSPTSETLYAHQTRIFGGTIGMSVCGVYILYAPVTPDLGPRLPTPRTQFLTASPYQRHPTAIPPNTPRDQCYPLPHNSHVLLDTWPLPEPLPRSLSPTLKTGRRRAAGCSHHPNRAPFTIEFSACMSSILAYASEAALAVATPRRVSRPLGVC